MSYLLLFGGVIKNNLVQVGISTHGKDISVRFVYIASAGDEGIMPRNVTKVWSGDAPVMCLLRQFSKC